MKLPCLIFKLGPLSTSWGRSGHIFRAPTAVGVVEIRTEEDLSQFGTLYLIHPWIDYLLDRWPVGSVVEMMLDDDASDRSFATDSIPAFRGSSGNASAGPKTRMARLVDRLGRLFGGRTTSAPRTASSLRSPSSLSPEDKQLRALQLIARLKQPFGALLLAQHRGNVAAYRRVAAESLITVKVGEITPTLLDKLVDSVQALDVL